MQRRTSLLVAALAVTGALYATSAAALSATLDRIKETGAITVDGYAGDRIMLAEVRIRAMFHLNTLPE